MVTSRFTNSNILRAYIADAQISPIYLCLSYFDIISITVELEELTKKGDFKEALLSVNDVIRNVVRTEELVELLVLYHLEPNRTETEPKQPGQLPLFFSCPGHIYTSRSKLNKASNK